MLWWANSNSYIIQPRTCTNPKTDQVEEILQKKFNLKKPKNQTHKNK